MLKYTKSFYDSQLCFIEVYEHSLLDEKDILWAWINNSIYNTCGQLTAICG